MAKNQNSFNAAAGLFAKKEPTTIKNTETVQTEEAEPTKQAEIATPSTAITGTQGRKGHKLPRINMAFTPDNHEYIKKVSRQQGISITEYVNNLITADKNK